MNKEILFLNPVFTHNIWGGTKLREEYGYDVEGDDTVSYTHLTLPTT